ncbi:MAG: response regulator [Microcoleus sp. PH2017_16_JOR_D_A]|nr:response regulator [Microcoleus sp. PH2017_16_JOR_D_A]
MANDDEDARFLVEEALREVRLPIRSEFVENGEQVLDYLYRREALTSIRSDPQFQQIPVVILTTSHRSGDILLCYRLGANSFISKPVTFQGLVEVMKTLCQYWFEIVSLPPADL